mgnify:CR=1 FL=1
METLGFAALTSTYVTPAPKRRHPSPPVALTLGTICRPSPRRGTAFHQYHRPAGAWDFRRVIAPKGTAFRRYDRPEGARDSSPGRSPGIGGSPTPSAPRGKSIITPGDLPQKRGSSPTLSMPRRGMGLQPRAKPWDRWKPHPLSSKGEKHYHPGGSSPEAGVGTDVVNAPKGHGIPAQGEALGSGGAHPPPPSPEGAKHPSPGMPRAWPRPGVARRLPWSPRPEGIWVAKA